MRRTLMSAVLLAAAVILQLTTINGLRLPGGGGVPDLVLVVVAALGLASGPAPGAIAGFAAGLCLDLAPPASGIIGEYALVFVLVGWACGRLHATLARSAVLPIVIVAAAAAAAELMVAGLSLALQPAQVSWAAVRQVLPAAVSYDIAISPFVLYLVLLAGAWLAEATRGRPALSAAGRALAAGQAGSAARLASGSGRWGLAGSGAMAGGQAGSVGPGSSAVLLGLGGWLSGPPEGRRARKAAARRTPRLRPGSGRPGDGWIGGSAAARSLGGSARRGAAPRGPAFRGQALGGQAPTGAALRGQAFRGRTVSGLTGGHGRPAASAARLRAGVAGSAAPGQVPRTLAARPVRLRLGARRRRSAGLATGHGGGLGAGRATGLGAGRATGLGAGRATGLGAGRSGRGLGGGSSIGGIVGSIFGGRVFGGRVFGGHGPVRPGRSLDRSAMAQLGRRRSRRRGGFRPSAMPGGSTAHRPSGGGQLGPAAPVRMGPTGRGRDGVIGGGALTRPRRTGGRPAAPRFRIQPGPGAGLSARRPATPRFRARPLAGAAPMSGKRPRFSRRRWRVLSMLTSRPGGRRDVWRAHGRRPGSSG
jgi:rod shape-determining protein MreD